MTSQLIELHFNTAKVRTLQVDGQPAFVVMDVCQILGIRNSRDGFNRLDTDERGEVGLTDVTGRKQQTQVCLEPGLYRLIFASRVPAARKFQRWIYHDVLPSLRKNGFYGLTPESAQMALEMARDRFKLARLAVKMAVDPEPGVEYLTLGQFFARRGEPTLTRSDKVRYGRLASKLCRKSGTRFLTRVPPGRMTPNHYWPVQVLEEVATRRAAALELSN